MADNPSTVLFLGAGASKPFGKPLTKEILLHILARLQAGELFTEVLSSHSLDFLKTPSSLNIEHVTAFPITLESRSQNELQVLFRNWLYALYPGLKQVTEQLPAQLPDWLQKSDQLPGITDVMSLLDHMLDHDEALSPRFQPKFLHELRNMLERAIMEVLEEPNVSATEGKEDQLSVLAKWISQQPDGRITIITTNYDTLLESKIYASLRPDNNDIIQLAKSTKEFACDYVKLAEVNKKLADSTRDLARLIDFGFVWRNPYADEIYYPVQNAKISIYKLHGSLNWLKCQVCGHNYINTITSIYERAYDRQINEANSCDCLHSPLRPVIVAPSMVRDIRDTNLLSIWQRALEALRTADRWIFSGYSLPNEDLAIRSILMKADRAHYSTKTVEVYQHKDVEKSRYEMMFPGCHYQTGGIEKFIEGLI